jgi:hypothetical protein
MTETYPDRSNEKEPPSVQTQAVAGSYAVAAASRGIVAKGDSIMTPRSLLGELTPPETRTFELGEPFRFLVHAVVHGSPADKFAQMEQAAKTRTTEGEKAAGYSLIDQEHTTTFEGYSGFIVEAPRDDEIYGTHATDVAVDIAHRGAQLVDGNTLLENTSPLGYNHITMQPKQPIGVLIRYRAEDQTELGNASLNDQLRQVAEERNLPVVRIPVERHPISAGTTSVEVAVGHDELSRNHFVRIPREGLLYEVQVIESAYTDAISFLEDGFAARWRRIDEYGMAETPQDPAELAEIEAELTKLIENGNDSPVLQYAQRKLSEAQLAT